MITMEEQSFLGRGWSFPPTFVLDTYNSNGSLNMVAGKEDIDQSLEILLSTSLGERVLQPRYGCNLKDYQFEAINSNLIGFLRDLISTAILYHEPRIELENLEISEGDDLDVIEGKLLISIDYIIRETNSRFNYVYPFFINEGAGFGAR